MGHLVRTTEFPKVVAIVGSRNFKKRERIYNFIKNLTYGTIVVSGEAPYGVDRYVYEMCSPKSISRVFTHVNYKGIAVENYEWQAFGKGAGHLRNADLVGYVKRRSGVVTVFTTQEMTAGSKNVIDTCKKEKVPYYHITEGLASADLIQPCPYCNGLTCAYCDVYEDLDVGWRPV